MRKLCLLLAVVAVAVTACQKDVVYNNTPKESESVELAQSNTRTYDEALEIAEDALKLLEGEDTRSAKRRVIKRNEGQVVMRPVTRGSETSEEPIMYVFNNENDEGFTVVAANRSQQPLIAVTEQGNYTYGEPTGVEPFDLMMEDVATTLSILPEQSFTYKVEIENKEHHPYGPLCTVQWGTGTIYGAMYPDSKAYDEAAAIAQILTLLPNTSYTITNPNDPLYGQTIELNTTNMKKHFRYDEKASTIGCNDAIHQQISRLYYEVGYRLAKGTTIGLGDKLTPFPFTKTKSVLNGFNMTSLNIQNYNSGDILPTQMTIGDNTSFCRDMFMFRGTANRNLPDNSLAYTWIATGFDHITYDRVEYTLNSYLNPSHPDPTGYTETDREEMEEFMLHINWGFDGISNGWFYSGCFDMDERVETTPPLGGYTSEYDYNFSSIQYYIIFLPSYAEIIDF